MISVLMHCNTAGQLDLDTQILINRIKSGVQTACGLETPGELQLDRHSDSHNNINLTKSTGNSLRTGNSWRAGSGIWTDTKSLIDNVYS